MKPLRYILAIVLLATASGCSQVKEPWVAGERQLNQERGAIARGQEALLAHRLWMGQTDR